LPRGPGAAASSWSLRNDLCFARRVHGRSGLARPRSRRAETPPAATRQRVSGRGPLGVRKKPRHRYPSRVPCAGSPQPPEGWSLAPTGRIENPPIVAAQVCPSALWAGVEIAGAAGGRSLRSPRGSRVRIGVGRRWPEAQRREQRGSRWRGALRGRGQRSVRPERLGRRKAAQRSPRHQHDKRPHAGKEEGRLLQTREPTKLHGVGRGGLEWASGKTRRSTRIGRDIRGRP
jgi:hypothetical protein